MTSTALPGAGAGASAEETPAATRPRHGHPWGYVSVGYVDRAGGTRCQLTVFPPGTTAEQRRGLLFRHQWLPWGTIVWFLLTSALSIIMNGWAAIAIGAAVYFGVLLLANSVAGAARHGVLEVHAQVMSLMGHGEVFGEYDLFERAAHRLIQLDDHAAAGRVNAVEYELRWGDIYRQIIAEQSDSDV